MRPSRPLPVILVGSTACSSTSLRAEGIKRASWRAASGVGAPVGGTGAGSALTTAGAAGAATAPPVASVSMVAITSPATTVPPSPLATLINTPSAGAGNSRTTLSVSMSIRFSRARRSRLLSYARREASPPQPIPTTAELSLRSASFAPSRDSNPRFAPSLTGPRFPRLPAGPYLSVPSATSMTAFCRWLAAVHPPAGAAADGRPA